MDFLTKLEVPLKKIQSKVKVDKEKGIFDSDSENEENHINSFDTSTSPSKNQKWRREMDVITRGSSKRLKS